MPKREQSQRPPEERRLGKTLEFLRILWSIDHGLQSRSKRMESSLGVTGPQRLVLRIVGRFPGISAGGIAKLLRLHPSTVTGMLQRLERHALLERRGDPEDRRRSLFRLTRAGGRLDTMRDGTLEGALRKVMGRLPSSKVVAAAEVLAAIAAELDAGQGS